MRFEKNKKVYTKKGAKASQGARRSSSLPVRAGMIRKGEALLKKKKYPDTRVIFSLAEIFAAKMIAERN